MNCSSNGSPWLGFSGFYDVGWPALSVVAWDCVVMVITENPCIFFFVDFCALFLQFLSSPFASIFRLWLEMKGRRWMGEWERGLDFSKGFNFFGFSFCSPPFLAVVL